MQQCVCVFGCHHEMGTPKRNIRSRVCVWTFGIRGPPPRLVAWILSLLNFYSNLIIKKQRFFESTANDRPTEDRQTIQRKVGTNKPNVNTYA